MPIEAPQRLIRLSCGVGACNHVASIETGFIRGPDSDEGEDARIHIRKG